MTKGKIVSLNVLNIHFDMFYNRLAEDASTYEIGAVISYVMEVKTEHLIAFASRF